MSKITQFSKDNLDSIRNDINEALKVIGDKYGIELKTGSLSYSTETFSVKVEAAIKVEGVSNSKDAQEFKKYSMIIGLQPSDLGREFSSNNKTLPPLRNIFARCKRFLSPPDNVLICFC